MAEVIEGWQCIGCGKISADRPCVGICQDRKVSLVLASDFDRLQLRNKKLESIVRRLLHSKPHANAWEQSLKALQAEASRLMSDPT